MKILFSGHHNPHFLTITEYLERAIAALGHDLHVFEDRRHLIPGRIRKHMEFLNQLDLGVINTDMRALARSVRPDIAIVTGGQRISAKTIRHIKRLGSTAVLWTTDPPMQFEPLVTAALSYDTIFCQGTEAIEMLARVGIEGTHWLPMACDPEVHHPVACSTVEHRQYGSDIVFVGSYYPERAALFEPLSALTSCAFAIWGPGWEALPAASPLRKHLKGRHTRPEDWLKIYSAGKIILSTHYHDPQKQFPVYQASPRVFEILACGAFQLCDDQRDVFTLFRDGRDLVKFKDGKDLVAKVQHYLAHPEERRAIAEQGRKTVLARHTYQERIKELLAKIGYA
jgi:spore maturation protein CgeB